LRFKGRAISKGVGEGEVLLSAEPISFLGGVDAKTGEVVEKNHPLKGKSVAGKILVFPRGKGSTVGSYVMYQLARNKVAPSAIINEEAEVIVAVGAIVSGIPMVDMLENKAWKAFKDGERVRVNGTEGYVEKLDDAG